MILEEVKLVIEKIAAEGIEINGTKEIQNAMLQFYIADLDIEKEEDKIRDYYNTFIEPYSERKALEKTHYDRLRADIKHEFTRHQWFTNHDKIAGINELINRTDNPYEMKIARDNLKEEYAKLDNFSGRRNIVFSLDCISTIQLLVRPNGNLFNVFIRSSDALKLLPIDILEMIKIFKETLKEFNIKDGPKDRITFFTTSCHYYLEDKKIVEEIL